jgi:hypothetical protein
MTDDVLESALDRLERAIRDLGWPQDAARAILAPERLAAAIAREPAARRTIDGLCRAWVVEGQLPALLDHATRDLFHARLAEAHSLGSWLRESGFQAPQVAVEPLLELLLIGYWKSFATSSWRTTLPGRPSP